MRRPTRDSADVPPGVRSTDPEVTGAIIVPLTNVSKPRELSAIPTCEGFVTFDEIVRWIPPAGSFEGKSNEFMITPPFKPLNPFSVTL